MESNKKWFSKENFEKWLILFWNRVASFVDNIINNKRNNDLRKRGYGVFRYSIRLFPPRIIKSDISRYSWSEGDFILLKRGKAKKKI